MHVRELQYSDTQKYGDIFKMSPALFDPDFAREPNLEIPTKMENALGEYFQITLFLITEKLKGENSDWKFFLDSLPERNDTIFTIPDQPIELLAPFSGKTLSSEL